MSNERSPTQYKGVRAIAPPDLTLAKIAPPAGFRPTVKGQLYLDTVAPAAYMWSGTTWISLGSGTVGAIVTLTGGSGGAIAPVAGNINLLGTANQITSIGTAGTITFSLPVAITAPGSLVTTTTLASGTTLAAGTSMSAATSITAGTTLTATLGNITATNGNIVRGTAGNKDVYTSVGSNATAGANSAGSVALIGGTIVVSTTAVTANSLIRLTCQALGTVTAPSALCVSAKTASTSFTILASQATDTSTIFWEIVN